MKTRGTAVALLWFAISVATAAGASDPEAEGDAKAKEAFPCEQDASFRAFDFWIGDWEVRSANGQLQGHNSIRSAERGCAITEHWTSASGSTGMSINYLDRTTDQWVQVWVADGGSQIVISGSLTDAGMSLAGTLTDVRDRSTVPFRGLWTPLEDGRVRQFFEQSNDGGETWVPWFEGFYSRVDKSKGADVS